MNEHLLIPDPQVIEAVSHRAACLFDQPWRLRTDAVTARGWVAVPVEKGRHVEPEDAPRLALALRQQGATICYAVATEPLDDASRCYQVAVSEEGLLEFSYRCAGLNYLLVPADLRFALLFTSEDFNLYAGPAAFVTHALGSPLAAAWAAFEAYADDPTWRGRLLAVYRRYRSLPGAEG